MLQQQQQGQSNLTNLTNLPYTFWRQVLIFLSIFDIINLFVSSKKFHFLIFSTRYKKLFESMDNVMEMERNGMERFGFIYGASILLFFK